MPAKFVFCPYWTRRHVVIIMAVSYWIAEFWPGTCFRVPNGNAGNFTIKTILMPMKDINVRIRHFPFKGLHTVGIEWWDVL